MLNVQVTSNGSTFRDRMATIAAGLNGRVDDAVKSFANELLFRLNMSAPVDTGQFRSNWLVTFDRPFPYFVPLEDYKARKGRKRPNVGEIADAEAEGHHMISTYTAPHVLYISNAAPYGRYLNDGTDKSPALHFVETSILDARRILTELRLIG